jgi:GNAT superfamily N-acetyltransferase
VTNLPLRHALAAHLGQVLTPEVAAFIEAAAGQIPADYAHDPQKFGALDWHGYVIAVERFADIVDELHPLHEAHWCETEKYRHGLLLNPDYERYAQIERGGGMVQFTVRRDGALVGNMRVFLAESLHTSTLVSTEDTVFIAPEHRGGFLVMALMRFAESAVRSLGVREVRVNSKLVNKADVLMRRLGYEPFGIQMVKFFKE